MKTIFEKSNGVDGINLTDEKIDTSFLDSSFVRDENIGLPQLGELDVMRHYKELSDRNFCIEKGFYPLGSCTMKYNPKVNEFLASLENFGSLHPLSDDEDCQGSLELMFKLQEALKTLTGMDAVTLQPSAGAHGELTGMMIIKKYFETKGDLRKKVIIPDSAHGTNPASAKMCGFDIVEIKSNDRGQVDIEALKSVLDKDVAAIMMTNPNTLGLFEENVLEISKLMHENPALKLVKLNTPLQNLRNMCMEEIKITPFGVLIQEKNNSDLDKDLFKVVTKTKPTTEQIEDAIFAWKVIKHTSTDSALVAKDFATLGIAKNETNSAAAIDSALKIAFDGSKDAVIATDGIIYSQDAIYAAVQGRVSLIIQPGGSHKDKDIIDLADRYGVAMIMTGIRNHKY